MMKFLLVIFLLIPAVSSAQVYYVAINEPGASNTACNGQAPTDQGNGVCPYKDFLSAHTFRLLWNKTNVVVHVRQGIYDMSPAGRSGLELRGAGTNDSELTILRNYQNELVVFDGQYTMKEVLRMSGQYNVIRGITVRNSQGYNIIINGGHHHIVENSVIGQNRLSDALKGTANATEVVIRGNIFYGWQSQAIDLVGVTNWVIRNNNFFAPGPLGTRTFGVKGGSRNITFESNTVRELGVALGGTTSPQEAQFEARDVTVKNNIFLDIQTKEAVKFYSCIRCVVENNIFGGTYQIAYLTSGADLEGPSGCPGGCLPSVDVTIIGNTFSGNSRYQGALFPSESVGFYAAGNSYCNSSQFFISPVEMTFEDWKAKTGQDLDSTLC